MILKIGQYYKIEEWDDEERTPTEGQAEFIVAKHRNGSLGTTYCYKNDSWSYIGELPYEEYCSLNYKIPYN